MTVPKKPQDKSYNHVQNNFGWVNSIRLIFLGGTIYLVALRDGSGWIYDKSFTMG